MSKYTVTIVKKDGSVWFHRFKHEWAKNLFLAYLKW